MMYIRTTVLREQLITPMRASAVVKSRFQFMQDRAFHLVGIGREPRIKRDYPHCFFLIVDIQPGPQNYPIRLPGEFFKQFFRAEDPDNIPGKRRDQGKSFLAKQIIDFL